MTPAAALVALYCAAAAPVPAVKADVMRALQGEPSAAAAPSKLDVVAAVRGAAALHKGGRNGR